MVLSDKDIHLLLRNGELVVLGTDPAHPFVAVDQVQPCSIDLRLGNRFLRFKPGIVEFDIRNIADVSALMEEEIRLFTDFLLPFEVAALILTVAVIAAVTLTLRKRPGTKHQNPGEQSRVRAEDRVRVVKMQADVRVVTMQADVRVDAQPTPEGDGAGAPVQGEAK